MTFENDQFLNFGYIFNTKIPLKIDVDLLNSQLVDLIIFPNKVSLYFLL